MLNKNAHKCKIVLVKTLDHANNISYESDRFDCKNIQSKYKGFIYIVHSQIPSTHCNDVKLLPRWSFGPIFDIIRFIIPYICHRDCALKGHVYFVVALHCNSCNCNWMHQSKCANHLSFIVSCLVQCRQYL